MIQSPNTDAATSAGEPQKAPKSPWYVELGKLLADAAKLAAEHDLDLDTFMRGAWSAYLESRPGMREELEEIQIRSQLDEIRKTGRMGLA